MTTKHTPGPWVIHQSTAESWPEILAPNGTVPLARINSTWRGEALANARLIAAAPELLEALGRISDSINGLSGPIPTRNTPEFWDYVKTIADEAISKATGH